VEKSVSLDEIKSALSKMLNLIRFNHTIAVSETALVLADRFGADRDKAYLAALLHDCARGLDVAQTLKYCEEHGLVLDEHMKKDFNPVHALVGADMAARRFGICDKDVLTAIGNHAVGGENMTLLDKIIFVADAIEPNRTGSDVYEARDAAERDLDKAMILALRIKTRYINSQEELMHPSSIRMLEKLRRV